MTLIFSDDADFGLSVAYDLREKRIFAIAYPCEIALTVSDRLDFGCVILDGRQHPPQAEALSEELFLRYPELPLCYLASTKGTPSPHASAVIRTDDPALLTEEIYRFCREIPGICESYSTFALQYDHESDRFTYLGYPLKLSNAERRLLRCVLHYAPQTAPTELILSTAFAGTRTTRASLATIAGHVNQAARAISGHSLIKAVRSQGYCLCGGILPPTLKVPTSVPPKNGRNPSEKEQLS